MIIAGIVIVLLAVLLGVVGVLGGGTGTVELNLGVGHVSMSPSAVFLLGALALLLLVIGLGTVRAGFRRARQHRQDRRRVDKLSRELDKAKHDAGMDASRDTSHDLSRERAAETTDGDRPTPI